MDKLKVEAWKRGAVTVGWGRKRVDEPIRMLFGVPQKIKPIPWELDLNLITSEYTGVVEVGRITAFQSRMRPAFPGCSIGHKDITAGTFGCTVVRNGVRFILSNNHVLANSNNAEIGDAILQPGPYDGGRDPEDQIATLHDFVRLRFLGEDSTCKFSQMEASFLNKRNALFKKKTRLKPIAHTTIRDAAINKVDAAIALPLQPNLIGDTIINIGSINGVAEGELDLGVRKTGRTTSLTSGNIIQTDVTVSVKYGDKTAVFEDQLMAGAMSQGGDSGSAVVDNGNRLVGLLFAGSNSTTIINRIQNVFNALEVSL